MTLDGHGAVWKRPFTQSLSNGVRLEFILKPTQRVTHFVSDSKIDEFREW